jgi:hypothetical protein
MIAVAKSVTHDWIFYVSFISGIAATWTTLYFRVIKPRQMEHQKREKEREGQRQEEHDWLHGKPATMGSPEIVSAPVKLQSVQDSQVEVIGEVKKLVTRVGEQNGKVDKIQLMVAGLVESGVKTRTDLGNAAIKVAKVAAQHQDEVLEAIHQHVIDDV